jgi:stearoyl-CoA desaturase (delta-9 desaturase)
MFTGLIDLPWWGYVVVALIFTHFTIASVTIFLHRSQAHRGLDLHAIPSHFFRFWLWLTTGMVTKEWVAIHRKHHAKCETVDDPHSPQILGISKVLREGAELYRAESKIQETLDKYGHGTPNDWTERNVYSPYSWHGTGLMLVINVLLFGPLGATIWAVQMMWIPITAAGIINGIGHYWGYRNYSCEDASTNIVPWGIIIGGEELHNNHHAFPTSARFSTRWYEFDLCWNYIRVLELLRLATVLRVAPKVRFDWSKVEVDADTVKAVIAHRYDVLTKYAHTLQSTCKSEIQRLRSAGSLPAIRDTGSERRLRKLLILDAKQVPSGERDTLHSALESSRILNTVHALRQELASIWAGRTDTSEQLVKRLEDWCRNAEGTGIQALQEFSRRLRSYA